MQLDGEIEKKPELKKQQTISETSDETKEDPIVKLPSVIIHKDIA